MKRPFLWVFGILLSLFLFARLLFSDRIDANYYSIDAFLQDSQKATAVGMVDNVETKTHSSYIYLKDVLITLDSCSETYSFEHLLIIAKDCSILSSLQPGNQIKCQGDIQSMQLPTNTGQFNEKAFYKEKNIYYKIYTTQIQILHSNVNHIKAGLSQLRKRIFEVFQSTMSKQDAGVVSAMLLGDKSILDADIKEQYQKNGIGHILAISGLHITILCMVLFQIFSRLPIPRPLPFILTTFFLIAYGIMTGFGISVNRSILMMLLMLFSKEVGRSYDPITAMACSAFVIFIQKPYAVFSCSFLLSYSAVLGIVLIFPVIKGILFGSLRQQNNQMRRQRRRAKEHSENKIVHLFQKCFSLTIQKIILSLLGSTAIWLATFPILLYFYYEIPTYGILLNLFVLPLVSIIVILSFLGGFVGLFFLPLAQYILMPVHIILTFYQWICHFFQELPGSIQVLGCPALWKILLYYIILLFLILFLKNPILYSEQLLLSYKMFAVFAIVSAGATLLYRPPVSCLQITMLDVGQGDGIFLQTETGLTILIDGGSTDTKQVGKYRILPFLKYNGIRKIDFMIMTHSDEDHISGQREMLEDYRTSGIKIGEYLLPKPAPACIDKNYMTLLKAAQKEGIPTKYIQSGDVIQSGKLALLCLHPDKNFAADSVNAYSTTLSLTYGNNSMLLTGDLEGNGEKAVLKELDQASFSLPQSYDILKVAHHGSKNSSPTDYLQHISPAVSLISCGKANRYGHPHRELLKRLLSIHTQIYSTSKCGAIYLFSDGKNWTIRTHLSANSFY